MAETETLRILKSATLHEHCEQVDGSDYVPVSMLMLAIRELKADRERIRELRRTCARALVALDGATGQDNYIADSLAEHVFDSWAEIWQCVADNVPAPNAPAGLSSDASPRGHRT